MVLAVEHVTEALHKAVSGRKLKEELKEQPGEEPKDERRLKESRETKDSGIPSPNTAYQIKPSREYYSRQNDYMPKKLF